MYDESVTRGYDFDRSKFRKRKASGRLAVTEGQLEYEWQWLMRKLRQRNPALYRVHSGVGAPQLHPLFRMEAGPVEPWEKV